MIHKYTSPRIFFPKTISEVLDRTKTENEAVFWAGGTHLARFSKEKRIIELPRNVISLGHVEELARASRSEHSLEIGSMMTLDRLAAIGRNTLPAGLYDAIVRIGSRPMRCRATIGGHLAVKDRIGDLKPLLQLLETTVETRYLKEHQRRRKAVSASRRFPIAFLEEKPGLESGEIISKISIPTDPWDFGVCRKVTPMGDNNRYIIFAALARIEKEVLTELRMAFSDGYTGVLRDRDVGVGMAGRALPLGMKELEILDEAVDSITVSWKSGDFERETAKRLARSFIKQAGR